MEVETFSSIFIVIITLFIAFLYKSRRKLNLPPGPTPYPLVGNLPLMRKGKSTDIYRRLRSEYGDIFKVQMGPRTFIVFNGYDVLREAFVKRGDVFSHRPNIANMRQNKGIFSNSGESWKRTRTFTLTALREFGFGRKSLQARVMEEVDVFLDLISQKNGTPFDITGIVFPSVANVICSIVFGDRFDHSDDRFVCLVRNIRETLKLASFNSIDRVFPFLKYIPIRFTNFKQLAKYRQSLSQFCKSQIKAHRDSYDAGMSRDLIDAFLREEKKHPGDVTFSEENLLFVLLGLFQAGTDTTATTIRWAILYMLHYPETQDKMREEIERVVGSSRTPTMEDKPELPYCQAFIIELLRISDIVPNSVPHCVSGDTTFRGFDIPEKAVLILNLDSVLNDPEIFPNPAKFDPSRFIGKDGKVTGYEKVIAFSIGRRICLGETLARMELFLYITSLVQRFKIKPVNSDKLPSLEGILGVTLSPNPYDFIAEPV